MAKKSQFLLFIDTNILLDFYRAQTDAGLSLLNHIDGLHDRIITTEQVEMEFKKNRQDIIVESLRTLKPPEFAISAPAFIREARTVAVMKKNVEDTRKRVSALKERIKRTLDKPAQHDPVFQTAQRLFNDHTLYNLREDMKQTPRIRARAWRRFIQGRPPRKGGDTSIGDSINWEWIMESAAVAMSDVLIVSRDTDYGQVVDGQAFINDWLKQEFKKRVGVRRSVALESKLSTALKMMSVPVTQAEEKEEEELESQPPPSLVPSAMGVTHNWPSLFTPQSFEVFRSSIERASRFSDFLNGIKVSQQTLQGVAQSIRQMQEVAQSAKWPLGAPSAQKSVAPAQQTKLPHEPKNSSPPTTDTHSK